MQTLTIRVAYVLVLCLLVVQAFERSSRQIQQSRLPTAPDPAFALIEDDPKLPRVLLIGDSISIGYTVPVRELLKGKANVHRIPVNGGPTTRGLESLEKWVDGSKWDVIHFNWGLHDLRVQPDGKHQVAIEEYGPNLKELVKRLQKTGAKLIWATTTPVPDAKLNPPRKNTDVIAYNEVAQKIMQEHEVAIDDLYTLALPQLEKIQNSADVHFSDDGSRVLAKQVADQILDVLGKN